MHNDSRRKQGNLTLIRGGASRRPAARTPDELWLDREIRTAFAAMQAEDGNVPSRGIYNIREDYQHPARILARRLREARSRAVDKQQVDGVIAALQRYVDRLYRNDPPQRAA